jgi:polysaccharide biosynthesis transport protein
VTFKQIIDVLWQRKWLIVAVVALAMVVAVVYLQFQVKSYTSSVDARTSVTASNAASGGELGGVQVDFDPSSIQSPKVLNKVAALTGSTEAQIAGSVSYVLQPNANANANTNTITFTAVAPTPQAAEQRARSLAQVYTNYLQGQIDSTLKTLAQRETAASAQAQVYQKQVSADPNNLIAVSNLQNAISDYSSLKGEIQSLQNAGSPITILQAVAPGEPVGPSVLVVLLIALSCGLIAAIGIALIRDQFDNRLRGENEIEPLTGLPSLGELSFDKTLRKSGEVLPAASNLQTPLNEGFRSLRTAMQVLLPRHNAVVVMTSVNPGDGKSFVSANTALTWARAGKQVILVGGDLRRPSLPTYFEEASGRSGLSDLLREAADTKSLNIEERVETLLIPTKYRGLRLIASGFDAEDPADLLANSSLKRIIEALRSRADIVIIDSPPSMALVDASILAENSDGIIVIATVRGTDRTALVATVDLLRQNGIKTLGVVANQSRRGLPKTYSPYYVQQPTGRRSAAQDETREEAESVSAPLVNRASPKQKPKPSTE